MNTQILNIEVGTSKNWMRPQPQNKGVPFRVQRSKLQVPQQTPPRPQNPPYLLSKIPNCTSTTKPPQNNRVYHSRSRRNAVQVTKPSATTTEPSELVELFNLLLAAGLTTTWSRGGRRVSRFPEGVGRRPSRKRLSRSHNRYATRFWPHSIKGGGGCSLELNWFGLLDRGWMDDGCNRTSVRHSLLRLKSSLNHPTMLFLYV